MAAYFVLSLMEDMLDKLGNNLRVSLGLKEMPPLREEHSDVLVVCDDSIMDHNKLIRLV